MNRLDRLSPSDPDGVVPMFHASPRDPVWEYVTSVSQARDMLEERDTPLVLIGHTHVAGGWWLRPDGAMEEVAGRPGTVLRLGEGRWLVNPGSVGQPRDGDARAAWALLDLDAMTLEFRRTPYDVAAAANAIQQAGLPTPLATRLSEGW
jgi:diadenosine tetraphosphatase ApaH/serine/threonine PP2A family protein phosphatase